MNQHQITDKFRPISMDELG